MDAEINVLNLLLQRNYDAEKGFKKAAEKTEVGVLKDFYQEREKMHYNFGHEIKAEIKKYGKLPVKGSTAEASVHRSWMDIKAFFSSDEEEAIIEECKRGEEVAIDEYQNSLKKIKNAKESTIRMIDHQYSSLLNSAEQLKQLEVES